MVQVALISLLQAYKQCSGKKDFLGIKFPRNFFVKILKYILTFSIKRGIVITETRKNTKQEKRGKENEKFKSILQNI